MAKLACTFAKEKPSLSIARSSKKTVSLMGTEKWSKFDDVFQLESVQRSFQVSEADLRTASW